jgi:hypothetical protein
VIVSYRQPKGQSIMDNPLAALGTQDAGQRLTKQKQNETQHDTENTTPPKFGCQ